VDLNFQRLRDLLDEFKFADLFVEVLGWNSSNQNNILLEIENKKYKCKIIAEMSGIPVYEVITVDNNIPDSKIRSVINNRISQHEKLLIFIDEQRTRSIWYWVKTENSKNNVREHWFVKGQSGDLFISKLASLLFSINELENGEPSVVDVLDKLKQGLDVEAVTKKFYNEFQKLHSQFITYIKGIDNENDRRWYTSVILNRLMFVYFLQGKCFLDNGDNKYLQNRLSRSKQKGKNNFYKDFLNTLFFKSFAKPNPHDEDVVNIVGNIKYLNGGLFLEHQIEKNEQYDIQIDDEAFGEVFKLFESYSWNLNDIPGSNDQDINPDVLGHVFEKYCNQKAFKAYYTKSEITEYLCDRTIDKLIIDRVNAALSSPPFSTLGGYQPFANIQELMTSKLDVHLCNLLIDKILPNLSILDPACGSGAFLLAALNKLLYIYSAVIGAIEIYGDRKLKKWLRELKSSGNSLAYTIKKLIITDNLYGVDIMEEATEIAKLRLFLALVASVHDVNQLEPLPNIDFNIMVGNSLIGLIKVDAENFDQVKLTAKAKARGYKQENPDLQLNLFQSSSYYTYRAILDEKNKSIGMYKEHAFIHGKEQFASLDDGIHQDKRLFDLRASIDDLNQKSQERLNILLLDEFKKLRIKYEKFRLNEKSQKDDLNESHITALKPFHWGYHFDKILERGGFDAIITNPPWEIFKPQAKEFFAQHDELVTKNKMDIKVFEKEQKRLLENPEIAEAWLEYQSQYPYISSYFRSSEQYKNQISIVNGKKAGTDINLYKLFLEQCFNLLRQNGECGIVIPSGIYTDLGAKQLREMLFNQTNVTGLFCLENRKEVFEGVHRSFKFVVLTFAKGGKTTEFPSAFMRHEVKELKDFPHNYSLPITIDMVRKLSPDSLSVMEFKNEVDVRIAEKMLKFPLLGEKIDDKWNLRLTREFDMTNDSHLFKQESGKGRVPLYEGKMIHQFTHKFAKPKYWVDEQEGRQAVLGRNGKDEGQDLDYQCYRIGFRSVASSTNERSLISSIVPKSLFCGNSLLVSLISSEDDRVNINNSELLFSNAILNSFVIDYCLRQKVTTNLNMFFVYQLPVPRLTQKDKYFSEICDRAAKLICTTPEFDELAQEVGLGSHTNGVTDEAERAKLRAELDGIIAHLYGLTEEEFAYILTTFPIVKEQVKQDALAAYREFAPLTGDADIIELITTQDESSTLEFKSTARWDVGKNQKNPEMEQVILKAIASFLNTEKGGTLLIGVTDDKEIIGLDLDYQTFSKPNKRDAYQLFLINDLLLRELGKDLATLIDVTFHEVERKDVCRITVKPSPRPVFIEVKAKGEKKQRCLFVRSGNLTSKLTIDEEIENYCKSRW
jgi:Alw26I/Eco31I/Esp3I family type II restriction m6 adenine DNA methyltransferase